MLLIKRDIPQFVAVFLVIIFSLGGALYLALIGHYNESNIATENNNDTRYVNMPCIIGKFGVLAIDIGIAKIRIATSKFLREIDMNV